MSGLEFTAIAAIVPLLNITAQGARGLYQEVRKHQPKFRINKWRGRSAEALKLVTKYKQYIDPAEVANFLYEHEKLSTAIDGYKAIIPKKETKYWEARDMANEVAMQSRELVNQAMTLSQLAMRRELTIASDPKRTAQAPREATTGLTPAPAPLVHISNLHIHLHQELHFHPNMHPDPQTRST